MRAVQLYRPGGAEQLYIGTVEKPVPKANELLVKVSVSALNRADILQREGKYPPPVGASEILGLELAGVVVECGAEVTEWNAGDQVFGLVPGGAQAEWAVIHKDMALRIPSEMTFEQCAAIPEVFLTAFQALTWLAKLKKGEKVIIHAGGSGVGTAAIQLVCLMDAEAIVTASELKHDLCRRLGAVHALDYRNPDFWDELKKITGGVDVIIDPVGGDNFGENLNLLKRDGRLVMLSAMGGVKTSDVNVGQIVFKRLTVLGSTLRSRTLEYQAALTRDFWEIAEKEFIKGNLTPVIDRVFQMDEIREAHQYMEANRNTGKVLLKIS